MKKGEERGKEREKETVKVKWFWIANLVINKRMERKIEQMHHLVKKKKVLAKFFNAAKPSLFKHQL